MYGGPEPGAAVEALEEIVRGRLVDDEQREAIEDSVVDEIAENPHLQDAIVALAIRTLVKDGIRCDRCEFWGDGGDGYAGECNSIGPSKPALVVPPGGLYWTKADHFCRMFKRRAG